MRHCVALFGEAEKGRNKFLHSFSSLAHLADTLGNPPKDSQGIHLAIQILLFSNDLIFIKVKEEGFSNADYFFGMDLLTSSDQIKSLSAICLPGVGDKKIIEAATNFCSVYKSILIITHTDLYDYLTH